MDGVHTQYRACPALVCHKYLRHERRAEEKLKQERERESCSDRDPARPLLFPGLSKQANFQYENTLLRVGANVSIYMAKRGSDEVA